MKQFSNTHDLLYLGCDHRGYKLKEEIKKYLKNFGCQFEDLGNLVFDKNDDYPDFGLKVAKKVSQNPSRERGILFCGSGNGMAIVANKFKRVRAALGFNLKAAKMSREHNDANILCLPADFLKLKEAKKIVKIWLETSFSGEERHIRRLNKIEKIETA